MTPAPWDPQDIARAVRGRWVVRPDPAGPAPRGASIDSRSIEPGNVFFALRGERVDGHAYVARAGESGAAMAIADDDCDPGGTPTLRVPDARAALGALASAWRARHPGVTVVGVTGSNGKTTTTRLIHSAIRGSLRSVHSQASYNNDLGLPLTLLNAPEDAEVVVCEIGTSSPGEIARLAQIARPDIGVITSIGSAHLEALGSREGIAREKGVLLTALGPGKLAIATADAPELGPVLDSCVAEVVRVGFEEGDVRVAPQGFVFDRVRFTMDERDVFELPIGGSHNAVNGAIAVLVARRLGLPDNAIAAGLRSAELPGGRGRPEALPWHGGKITLLDDAYNANPDSMLAAIGRMSGAEPGPGGRRVLILGDMLELGDAAVDLHLKTLFPISPWVDRLVLVGPAMREAAAAAAGEPDPTPEVIPELTPEAIDGLVGSFRAGDVVLLKGSRSMRLERVAEAIRVHSG